MSTTYQGLLKSQGRAFRRSPGLARLRIFDNSTFDVYLGLIPIWGFGEFIATGTLPDYSQAPGLWSGSFNSPWWLNYYMTDIWPQVYSTMTEVWTQSDGQTSTRMSVWNPWIDNPLTTTYSGSTTLGVSFVGTFVSVTKTVLTCSYSDSNPTGITGTYVATISGQADNASNWATLTGSADSLQIALTTSDLSPAYPAGCRNVWAAPNSSGGITKSFLPDGLLIGCVSTYGVPVRCSAENFLFNLYGSPGTSVMFQNLVVATNIDETAATAIPYGRAKNMGFVIASHSDWNLTGFAPDWGGTSPNFNLNDHTIGYMQAVTVDTTGSTTSDYTVTMNSTVSVSADYPGPLSGAVSFAASVPTGLGSSFGMLGFRSAAA